MLEVLYHHAKFGGARISSAALTATNVEFFGLSVPRRIPILLHVPGCNLGMVGVPSSCALLGGFAIGARVSLL